MTAPSLTLAPAPAQSKPLWEIQSEIVTLIDSMDMIPADQPELLAEAQEALERLIEAELRKVDNAYWVHAQLEIQAELMAREAAKLQKRKRSLERAIERLDAYAMSLVEASPLKRLEGGLHSISLRKCPASVEIDNAEALPARFVCTQIVETPDKMAIKAELRAGREVSGARLVADKVTVKWS